MSCKVVKLNLIGLAVLFVLFLPNPPVRAQAPVWTNTGNLAGATEVYSLLESGGAIYAGTGPNGDVFKSIDWGSTWSNTGDLVDAISVSSLLQATDGIYAGAATNIAGVGSVAVFKSTDGGTIWIDTTAGLGVDEARVGSLLQTSSGTIYAGLGQSPITSILSHLIKTTDGGITWSRVGSLSGGWYTEDLLEASDGTIYLGGYLVGVGPTSGRIYSSLDGGATWNLKYFLNGLICSLLQTSDGTIYAGGIDVSTGDAIVIKSTDGGTTWTNTGNLAGATTVYSLLESGEAIYAGTGPNGDVFKLVLPPASCTSLACENANPSLPCSCGTAIADAVNPWCCAGNNAVYNSKATCQVGACTPTLLHLLVPVGLCLAEENAMTRTLLILMNQNPANFVIYL